MIKTNQNADIGIWHIKLIFVSIVYLFMSVSVGTKHKLKKRYFLFSILLIIYYRGTRIYILLLLIHLIVRCNSFTIRYFTTRGSQEPLFVHLVLSYFKFILRTYFRMEKYMKYMLNSSLLLTRNLLNKGFLLVNLKLSLQKFYGCHHDLVDRYRIAMSQMTTYMFHLS